MTDHALTVIPPAVFELDSIRTLDLSHNKLKELPNALRQCKSLKTLNCEHNKLTRGSISPSLVQLKNLTSLSLGHNRLEDIHKHQDETASDKKRSGNLKSTSEVTTEKKKRHTLDTDIMPVLPSLKTLKLNNNGFRSVPPQVYSPLLIHLEILDLSRNHLEQIPPEIQHLVALQQLNLDHNSLISVPSEIGTLKKLKSLSLQYNQIRVLSSKTTQPLPESLFTNTVLIDLNLTGNPMTNTQLNEFQGFPIFLERRQKLKSKNIYGGALTDLSVCGLD